MSLRLPQNVSWVDTGFQRVRGCHISLWNLLCCFGRLEKYFPRDFSHDNCGAACEKYLCCLEDVYRPISKEEFDEELISDVDSEIILDRIWFAKGESVFIEVMQDDVAYFVNSSKLIPEIWEGDFTMGKEISKQYKIFGCIKLNQIQPKTRKIKVSMRLAEILMEKLRRAQLVHPISVLTFVFPKHPKKTENILIVEYDDWDLRSFMGEELKKARLDIEFLVIDAIQCKDPSVLWETISFKHFAIKNSSPLHLTKKMISCGFLGVNGVISNPECLKTFNGFGLLLKENYLPIETLYEEIEKCKSNTTSDLQLISIVFPDDRQHKFEEAKEYLLNYSSNGTSVDVGNDYGGELTMIPVDESRGAAVLISLDTITFTSSDWKRKAELLGHLMFNWIIKRF